jgi:hypothetical protein
MSIHKNHEHSDTNKIFFKSAALTLACVKPLYNTVKNHEEACRTPQSFLDLTSGF